MKVVKLRQQGDLEAAQPFLGVADRLLFDAKPPATMAGALPGGNAVTFDWRILAGTAWPLPGMLAGGLAPENVAEAGALARAPAVDVSSGVEDAPGRKSVPKIKAFLAAVKALEVAEKSPGIRPAGHCGGRPDGAKSAPTQRIVSHKDKTSPMETLNTYRGGPDEAGHFGLFGGRFVAETLMPLILEVERAYNAARKDASFQTDYDYYAKHYIGRPEKQRVGKRGVRTS